MKECGVQPAISVSSLEEAPESWRGLPEMAVKAPGFPASLLAESRRLQLLWVVPSGEEK